MFSRRSFVPPGDNELSALHRRNPGPHLDWSLANPTRVGLERPDFAAILGRGRGPYVPDPRGWRPAREAVADIYRGRGVDLGADDVVLTASTSEAYSYLLTTLCDPGDAIAVPEPSYPLFEHLARLQAVEVVRYRLAYDGAWHLDPESLARIVGPRVRAIFAVSPNNPTGSFLKPDELERLWGFGVPVVVDEVFRPYRWSTFEGPIAEPLARAPVLTCVLDGLSKRIGAPELKLGWIALAGPQEEEAVRRLEYVADTFLSVSSPVQRALPELLRAGEPFRALLMERIERNLAALRTATAGSPVTVLHGEGGWYATLRLPAVLDEPAWLEELLRRERLAPHPGWLFDFEQGPSFVVSLILPEAEFADASRRLVACATRRCS